MHEPHNVVRLEDFTADSFFVNKFEIWANVTSTAPALKAGAKVLTYQELNGQANQLAHYLRTQGIGPEICVGVSLNRSPLLLISFLAILKAGGVYFPIDPAY